MDVLTHHGIKGQKWGERNYQYEDGTLTPEGKIRYGKTTGRQRSQMSEGELKSRIERLKLEKELKNLENETVGSGRAFVQDVLKSAGKKVAVQLITAGTIGLVSATVSSISGIRTADINKTLNNAEKMSIAATETLNSFKKAMPSAKDQW